MISILIGIFSYNEGENLLKTVEAIINQTEGIEREILLLDESTHPESIDIVLRLINRYNLNAMEKGRKRKGKAAALNTLYDYFLHSSHSVLLHFDSDLILEERLIKNLVKAIREGIDLVTGLSIPLDGKNMIERSLSLIAQIFDTSNVGLKSNLPLVGHFGAYSRHAVCTIYPIKERIVEDLYVLERAINKDLSMGVLNDCVCYFRLPDNINDFITNIRRNSGGNKAFLSGSISEERNQDALNIYSTLYKTKLNRHYIKRILPVIARNPLYLAVIPWLLLIRVFIGRFSVEYTSPILNTIPSSKKLQ